MQKKGVKCAFFLGVNFCESISLLPLFAASTANKKGSPPPDPLYDASHPTTTVDVKET